MTKNETLRTHNNGNLIFASLRLGESGPFMTMTAFFGLHGFFAMRKKKIKWGGSRGGGDIWEGSYLDLVNGRSRKPFVIECNAHLERLNRASEKENK